MSALLRTRVAVSGVSVSGMEVVGTPLTGMVGIEAPWAFSYKTLPNGDYDLAWFFTDRFPFIVYVAAKRGMTEKGDWFQPASKIFTPAVDAIDLRGLGGGERVGPSAMRARGSSGHEIVLAPETTFGALAQGPVTSFARPGSGGSPYGDLEGAALGPIVARAYSGAGIGSLGAAPAVISPLAAWGW